MIQGSAFMLKEGTTEADLTVSQDWPFCEHQVWPGHQGEHAMQKHTHSSVIKSTKNHNQTKTYTQNIVLSTPVKETRLYLQTVASTDSTQ